jgi:hypothetical protein
MKNLYIFLLYLIGCAISFGVSAQGCVAVRQMGGVNALSGGGYALGKGEFTTGLNYRYFHSWRHFVGTEEQHERQTTGGGFYANGVEKGNAVNIYSWAVDLNFAYAINDRLQVSLAIPYVHNERSQVLRTKQTPPDPVTGERTTLEGIRYSVFAQGLGDIRATANYWIFNPATAAKGNLQAGIGIKSNSGSHSRRDNGLFLTPNSRHGNMVYDSLVTMDQAIQPGDGGVGFSLELTGFRKIIGGLYGFANGYYLFNPRESNGSFKSLPTVIKDENGDVLATMNGYNVYASPDQYFARAGVSFSFLREKNLTLSAAGRFEGIPAYDVFGGQKAYRRPGYVVAVESGVSFRQGNHIIGLFIPYNFIKNRIQSAADIESQRIQNSVITNESDKVHVQGDAAFADYSINISYTYRLGKLFGKKAGLESSTTPTHIN